MSCNMPMYPPKRSKRSYRWMVSLSATSHQCQYPSAIPPSFMITYTLTTKCINNQTIHQPLPNQMFRLFGKIPLSKSELRSLWLATSPCASVTGHGSAFQCLDDCKINLDMQMQMFSLRTANMKCEALISV